MKLTEDQQAAYKAITDFLLNQDKEMVLTGSPGVGKSALISWFISEGYPKFLEEHPEIELRVKVVATTNKAANVLNTQLNEPITTIHSFLGLKVHEDTYTGKTRLIPTSKTIYRTKYLLFIDECSMIDEELYELIQTFVQDSKIIYVGDKDQLAPVENEFSAVFVRELPTVTLTQNVRLSAHQELLDLAEQLRFCVNSNELLSITTNNVVTYLNKEEYREMIDNLFISPSYDNKIVAFTNKRVLAYNDYIKYQLRKYKAPFVVGEHYLVNTAFKAGKRMLQTDEEVVVKEVGEVYDYPLEDTSIRAVDLVLTTSSLHDVSVTAVVDIPDYLKYLNKLAKKKRWQAYFGTKKALIDLRLADCSTVHKAQGSTYKNILIDLEDIYQCKDRNMLNRLLYVACTRATDHIYLYRGEDV